MWAKRWFFPNDNARPYTALSVKEFLSVHEITLMPHAPYSPDLSHCDFSFILTTETSTETPWLSWHSGHSDGRDKTALKHITKCFPGLLQRPPEMLEAVYWWRRKLFCRTSLASDCKYTIPTLIPPVSELTGHIRARARAHIINMLESAVCSTVWT